MEIDPLLGDTPLLSPGRIAITDGNRSIVYGQLGSIVRSEAALLRETGGLRFGLLAENGCDWAVADLAIHHLNRVNVPLPAYFTPAQMRHAIDDAGVDTLVTDRRNEVLDRWPEFSLVGTLSHGLAVLQRAVDPAERRAVPIGTSKVTYTSGSTAEPKGVCLPSAALDRASRAMVQVTAPIGIRRHLCLLPLPTLLENLAGIHAPLRSGATCVVPSSLDTGMSYGALDPQRLLRSLTLHRPESLVLVPELLRLIVRASQSGYGRLPDSLKFIAVGGAPVAPNLLEEAAALRLPVFEGYGLSECGSVVCLNTPQARRLGSVGRALPHVRLSLDKTGELRVSGWVMSGYLGDTQAHGPQEIATGDLAEIDADGYVFIRGRLRNLFITSFGRNVSPEWIERELAHEPAIRHALAIGEGRPDVRALVCPATPELEQSAIVRAVEHANERLPDYARVRHVARMPEAPTLSNGLLTANGRLRRERILERFGALLEQAA
jgi:long-subunit acyl-CoA synthetase (AMP-forming)